MSILIYFAQKQKFDLQNGFCIASKSKRWCGDLGSHIFIGAFYSVFMLPTLEYSSLAQTLPLDPRLIYPMICWTTLHLTDISEVPDWVPHPLLPPLFTHSTQVFSTSVNGCLCPLDWSDLTFWNHPWLLYRDIQFSKTSCWFCLQNVSRIWLLNASTSTSNPVFLLCKSAVFIPHRKWGIFVYFVYWL